MSQAEWLERWRRATSPGRVVLETTVPRLDGAACTGMDGELWFTTYAPSRAFARDVCASCPVRERCLQFALEERIAFGIWGGLDERERVRLIEERRAERRREQRRVAR